MAFTNPFLWIKGFRLSQVGLFGAMGSLIAGTVGYASLFGVACCFHVYAGVESTAHSDTDLVDKVQPLFRRINTEAFQHFFHLCDFLLLRINNLLRHFAGFRVLTVLKLDLRHVDCRLVMWDHHQ